MAHDLTEKSEKVEDGEAASEVTCEASICLLHLCVVDMVSKRADICRNQWHKLTHC